MNPFNSRLPRLDELVEEVAVSVNINGINHAVMMAADDLDDFAIGFLFGEGSSAATTMCTTSRAPPEQGWCSTSPSPTAVWRPWASASAAWPGERLRHLRGGGHRACAAGAHPDSGRPLRYRASAGLARAHRPWQSKARQSGALHAALALNDRGDILACREDIGRHNALDKLIGMQLLRQSARRLILWSSPAAAAVNSFTRRCNLAPLTSSALFSQQLAVRLALKYNLTLIHVPRSDAPVCYASPRAQDHVGEPHVPSY